MTLTFERNDECDVSIETRTGTEDEKEIRMIIL